jgi:hypothetical protein
MSSRAKKLIFLWIPVPFVLLTGLTGLNVEPAEEIVTGMAIIYPIVVLLSLVVYHGFRRYPG